MKILISAAEASSDVHGAHLLKALASLTPEKIDALGVGGPYLQAEGLRVVVDARSLLSMGFAEILSRLPRIFESLRRLEEAARAEKPDVAVLIDYPDFHFRLARRLSKLGIPLVYYIPPKLWVWRKKRIRVLRELFSKVLCIFPFEKEFYEKQDLKVAYVGNPLADELPLGLTKEAARSALGLKSEDLVITLMPGSRPAEVKRHTLLFLEAANIAAAHLRASGKLGAAVRLVVLIPLPKSTDLSRLKSLVNGWLLPVTGGLETPAAEKFILDIRISQGNAHECLVASEAGLIKSGTSTLEAALLRCPHAIVYKPNLLTQWIFQFLIRYRGPVGLVNLVHRVSTEKEYLVKEILCEKATVGSLSAELRRLLSGGEPVETMKKGFDSLKLSLFGSGGDSPSKNAAREVLEVLRAAKGSRS
jgi:lipid-A-disaccharide synthase